MGATVKPLSLYDLLTPQFLAGIQFPDFIDKYLSALAVADLQSTSDASSILYTGTVFFPDSLDGPPVLQHRDPTGQIFDITDLTLQFRLLVPRAGSPYLKSVIDTLAVGLQPLKDVLDSLGAQTATPTDYPGVAFNSSSCSLAFSSISATALGLAR